MKMQPLRPRRYFWKILSTIGVVSIIFQVITLSTLAYFMVVPLGQRATEDLANVMIHAAEHWQALPLDEQSQFVEDIRTNHDLVLSNNSTPLQGTTSLLPYVYFLEKSLSKKLGQDTPVKQKQAAGGEDWFWVDFKQSGHNIRFGFPRSRIGVNPPIVIFLLISIGLYLAVATAVKLTRRLTIPIERLHQAAQDLGKGHWPEPIQIDGPRELSDLAREFNRMNEQVKELLSNRTALFAGISHDLRTPLTQVQLALSMLPKEGGNPQLMQSIRTDLDQINQLIGETLSISIELEKGDPELINIGNELTQIIRQVQKQDIPIHFSNTETCERLLHPLALRRVLTNLLVNALRYGNRKPVSIRCRCDTSSTVIEILDHGPGIPPEFSKAVFRPFFRLEKSRGSGTGGSGLGLAIVQQLAYANRWDITLHARQEGGTRAILTLPNIRLDDNSNLLL